MTGRRPRAKPRHLMRCVGCRRPAPSWRLARPEGWRCKRCRDRQLGLSPLSRPLDALPATPAKGVCVVCSVRHRMRALARWTAQYEAVMAAWTEEYPGTEPDEAAWATRAGWTYRAQARIFTALVGHGVVTPVHAS